MAELATKEVENSLGKWTIRKPKAGVKNKALIEAEISNGNYKVSKLGVLLLPKCIVKRPADVDQTVPIDNILDDMDPDDYDVLLIALMELINPEEVEEAMSERDVEKKKTS